MIDSVIAVNCIFVFSNRLFVFVEECLSLVGSIILKYFAKTEKGNRAFLFSKKIGRHHKEDFNQVFELLLCKILAVFGINMRIFDEIFDEFVNLRFWLIHQDDPFSRISVLVGVYGFIELFVDEAIAFQSRVEFFFLLCVEARNS